MAKKSKTPEDAGGETSATFPAESSEGRRENKSLFFREYYRANPKMLKERGIKDALDKWLQANPGHSEVPRSVMQAAFNVKTSLNKNRKKRKRQKAEADAAGNGVRPAAPKTSVKVLQSLEEQIDQCLFLARSSAAESLSEVIESLRQARNDVVRKQGKQGTA